MNKPLEDLIIKSNMLNCKILEYQDKNILTKSPQAKVKDVQNNEVFFLRYDRGEWKLL